MARVIFSPTTLPMLALKFSHITLKKIMPFLILALILVVSALALGWLCVPVTFIAYVILSLAFQPKQQETHDV